MEYKIKVPKKGSYHDSYSSWVTNYGNIIYLIWKERNSPIKEIENVVDVITHEFVHLIIREIAGLSTCLDLDNVTFFDGEKQQCYYKVGDRNYICPIY